VGSRDGRSADTLVIWERSLGHVVDGQISVPLRFRVVPGVWPNIRLTDAEGTSSDISASSYELRLGCDPGAAGSLHVEVGGLRFSLRGRTVTADATQFVVPGSGALSVRLHIDGDRGELIINDHPPVSLRSRESRDVSAAAITANIADFRLRERPSPVGSISVGRGVDVRGAMLFGKRAPVSSIYRAAQAAADGPGALFYRSDRFSVFDDRVVDAGDDQPALVPDSRTIVSPIRVVEEFSWRDNTHGDMTRVVDRSELWRSRVEPGRFLGLSTSFRSINAAFELALETFQRNSGDEFALPGESGLWSAGYFQGSGLGFGVWKRDTSHVALRCGNLIDPEVARASLAYVVNSGFDNGSDGDSLPAVGIWDHVLATGDDSLARETWDRLSGTAAVLDGRFDESRGLVRASQSTSNDSFDEPEVGGFALSTVVYSMQSYEALSSMAALPGINDERGHGWGRRAEGMRRAIIDQYWNPAQGFFTSGPRGSESFALGQWETSGVEAALWGYLGDEADALTGMVLRRLRDVAMSEFGIVLFPHREQAHHFCGSVWYCWQAGIARAAARSSDAGLVHRLVAQHARTILRNKTFYEVTDAESGESWRWPGQLWHAAGFVSLMLFGVLGIQYDLTGMRFTPAVSKEFEGTRVERLRYRSAELDIEVRGHGTRCRVMLDGRRVDRVPPDIDGHHVVVLVMR